MSLNLASRRRAQPAISQGPSHISHASRMRAAAVRPKNDTGSVADTRARLAPTMSQINSDSSVLPANTLVGPTWSEKSVMTSTSKTWSLGQIVTVAHMVQSYDRHEKDENLRVFARNIRGYICLKVHYAVIVTLYATRMIVLPMYSCHQNGVRYKSKEYQLTALSVFNRLDPDPQVRQNLTEETLCVKGMKFFYPGSHVNVNCPLAVDYSSRIDDTKEELDDKSKNPLLKRYSTAHLMAYQADQMAYYHRQREEEVQIASLGSAGFKVDHIGGATTVRTSSTVITATKRRRQTPGRQKHRLYSVVTCMYPADLT